MTPEQRLFLSVILLAVGETDIRYVTRIKFERTAEETLRVKRRKVIEAIQFVSSPEFDEICNNLNVDAARMRSLDPAKAHKLLLKINDSPDIRKELDAN